jgi:hypothetical protein
MDAADSPSAADDGAADPSEVLEEFLRTMGWCGRARAAAQPSDNLALYFFKFQWQVLATRPVFAPGAFNTFVDGIIRYAGNSV